MSVADTIESIDKYSVQYIRFVLSVTSKRVFRNRAQDSDLNNKIITFSVISVVLGDFLYTSFIAGKPFTEADTIPRLITEFSLWIALALLSFAGVNLFRDQDKGEQRSEFAPVLVLVLRVLPAAFVISCYIGLIAHAIDELFSNTSCAAWHAISVTILMRCIFALIYLPIALCSVRLTQSVHGDLKKDAPLSHRRAKAITIVVVAIMLVTDLTVIGAYILTQAETQTSTIIAAVQSKKVDLQDLSNKTNVKLAALKSCQPGGQCNVDAITNAIFLSRQNEVGSCFGIKPRTAA